MPSPSGQPVGVLMLDTSFPRPVGDIGNPASFDCPVIYRRLPGAMVSDVVVDTPLPARLVDRFAAAARALEADGAMVITTSCGFLAPVQAKLQAAVNVPVVTSSLHLLPHLRSQLDPDETIGILTFDANRLSARHFGDHAPIAVAGLPPGSHLHSVIANDLPDLDTSQAALEVEAAFVALLDKCPGIKTVVMECTNLPPYKDHLLKHHEVRILDIFDAISRLKNKGNQ